VSLSISNRPRRFLGAFTHDLAAVSSEPYEPAPQGRFEGPTKLIAFNPRIGQTTYAIPIRSMYGRLDCPIPPPILSVRAAVVYLSLHSWSLPFLGRLVFICPTRRGIGNGVVESQFAQPPLASSNSFE
jgi:hypothetical protein